MVKRGDFLSNASYQPLSNENKQLYYERTALGSMLALDKCELGARMGLETMRGFAVAKARLKEIFTPRDLAGYELTPTGFVNER